MGWWPFTKRSRQTGAVTRTLVVRAKFDSAQTTPDNRRHWANADGLSADAAAAPEIRRTLRNRSRYEVANNSYARGIVLTLANDVIGTGPRLQMLLGDGGDSGVNGLIEKEFAAWGRGIDLAGKLRTMRMARAQDGEAFGILFSNGALDSPVKLDIKLIEADQVATPGGVLTKSTAANAIDGIEFDSFGNPLAYHILKSHPGSGAAVSAMDCDRVKADGVIHWFRSDRPGQRRGLPDIMPALPLFAQLRRYTLAVIAAAESAANVAVLMKTSVPAGGEAAEVEPMTEMEFSPNMAVFTPEGWEPSQIKAEQPATTYEMFKREILNEVARCLNMPLNIALCNSSGYNYASGRLDHQTYFKSIRVEQAHCETVVLDRILTAWLAEAVKVYPELSQVNQPTFAEAAEGTDAAAPHQWFWDGHEHVDPAKEANAQATRLASSTTTLASEYARQGKDWETELRQRAKEVAFMKELGLGAAPAAPPAESPEQDKEQDDEDEQSSNQAA
ncbi:MAG: Phage portal protein, lambda family [Planctomycetes bacterium ADurb.Bin126]|nr:MAG: Phage portal protein, lambda family [Planctomycetes bacterium ADurb.Bin126]